MSNQIPHWVHSIGRFFKSVGQWIWTRARIPNWLRAVGRGCKYFVLELGNPITLFTGFLVIVSGFQLLILEKTDSKFGDQLTVMQGQLDQMRLAGEQTTALVQATSKYADATAALAMQQQEGQRPIVDVEAEAASSLVANGKGASLWVRFILKNDTGRRKAERVSVVARMHVPDARKRQGTDDQKNICAEAGRKSDQRAAFIQEIEVGGSNFQELEMSVGQKDIDAGIREQIGTKLLGVVPISKRTFIALSITGCADYRSGAKRYQRGFVGVISGIDPERGAIPIVEITRGSVSTDGLQVRLTTTISN